MKGLYVLNVVDQVTRFEHIGSVSRITEINFHRPCLLPSEVEGPRGRIKKRYRQRVVATPYDKLKSLDGAEDFLRPGVTFEEGRRAHRRGGEPARERAGRFQS